MKRFLWILAAAALLPGVLAGCSGQKSNSGTSGQGEFFILHANSQQLFQNGTGEEHGFNLGIQFLKGEPVQLWCSWLPSEEGDLCFEAQLRHADDKRETLSARTDSRYRGSWYLDNRGEIYILLGNEIVRLDSDLRELWRSSDTSLSFSDICQLSDGNMILLVRQNGIYKLARLDPANGRISLLDDLLQQKEQPYIAADGKDLLLLQTDGISKLDFKTGKKTVIMSFKDAYYFLDSLTVADFRLTGSDSASILYQNGRRDDLHMENIAETRTVISLRSGDVAEDNALMGSWLRSQIVTFNKQNDRYYVVMENRTADTAYDDYTDQTAMQLGTGKAADIIQSNAVKGAYSLIEKGIFEDLTPYMEQSGIRQEDYFPAALDMWKIQEAVYGVNLAFAPHGGITANAALLGISEAPSLEELLDLILTSEQPLVFCRNWPPRNIMLYLLQGSENLWGMLDWENGVCSFDNDLFKKILTVAKERSFDSPGIQEDEAFLSYWNCSTAYQYEDLDRLQSENRIPLGYYYDDGNHPNASASLSVLLAVNSASKCKEGAWTFLSYLMGEEAQSQVTLYDRFLITVSRSVYDAYGKREIARGPREEIPNGTGRPTIRVNGDAPLTQERVQEYGRLLENARSFPIRTQTVLTIIDEEAARFFNGEKDLGETCRIIENRVGLYLSERK